MEGVLLYCIADAFDIKIKEIDGMDEHSKLYVIPHKSLYAVVSNVNLEEYGEENIKVKGEDVEWLKEKAEKFMDIMLSINETSNIIPMKFLTIFITEERVQNVIEENYEGFMNNFEKISGCEEFSLKIYCDTKLFKNRFMKEEIEKYEKTISEKPKGAAFFLRKKFDSELDNKVEKKFFTMANSMISNTQKFATDMKSNKLLAKEITGISLTMISNCAFLINLKNKKDFIEYTTSLKLTYEEGGFIFECSGPWPPYNFID